MTAQGSDTDADSELEVAMYHAVLTDNPAELRRLIENGGDADLFYQDMTLISAKSILHMCCEKGRFECVKVLLDCGADPTIQDTWYQTPLMYCMLTQYEEIAELILQRHPGTVDLGDKYGKKAIHIAVEVGSVECVKVLIRYDADVNEITHYGVTPLILACGNKSLDPDTLLEITTLLLHAGADVNMTDFRDRRTALQAATITKHVSVIEMLIAAGADPNRLDRGGRSALTNAIWYHRHLDATTEVEEDLALICIMLTQAGTNLNMSKYEQSNALCVATMYRCTDLVSFFIGSGASQNVSFYCGITPLQIATRNHDVKTMKVLLNWHSDLYRNGRVIRGALDYNTDVFHLAMDIGAFEIGVILANAGYDITKVDYLVDWSLKPPNALLRSPDMLEYFRERASIVTSLFNLTLYVIRKTLHDDISERAKNLPLPKSFIKEIQVKDDVT